ncbi:class I SAM-dependent methyltransferase [Gordonia zhaorongruii]|uniref:class I SAM-dependent methyltransferase n=1 Tax=Gordonia zhaorongruii TaxID=2597659 RepID=UPI001048E84D|nr:class I SAM-dependent methyltransferase [Gordonia zhaorongruii]
MTDSHDSHDSTDEHRILETAEDWDELYRASDRVWTTNVNPALVDEAADLEPGTALDLGSGEGADVRWLADRGWQVTGVDISAVAIERAAAADSRPTITWLRLDVSREPLPSTYQLVTMSYFGIARSDETILRRVLDAVAPGGTLLMTAHDLEGVRAHGYNPENFLWPADVLERLGDGWEVVTDERRDRPIPAGNGHHVRDVVLRARRVR